MVNSVDPDETARYEPSRHDIHCLHRYLLWSARRKELRCPTTQRKGCNPASFILSYSFTKCLIFNFTRQL